LTIISNDIWMIVTRLEKFDLLTCETGEIAQ
jgi:hypothetical protein